MSRPLVGILLVMALLLTGCASELSSSEMETNAQNGDYAVDGAVLHAGTFHLPPNHVITLALAIRRCGGPWKADNSNDGGDLSSVRVQRVVTGSVVAYTLDVSPGGRDEGFLVKPGDFIFVPKRAFSTNVPIPVPYSN